MGQVALLSDNICGAVSEFVKPLLEDRPNAVRFVATGKHSIVEGVNFFLRVVRVGAEAMDSKDHSEDQAGEDSGRMGGMGRNV